jgi:peptide subunit release factor 1 (eRF1)
MDTYQSLIETIIVHANKEQLKDREKFLDKSTGLEMEQAAEPQSLLEWFAEKYKEFGANLEVGSQLSVSVDFTLILSFLSS